MAAVAEAAGLPVGEAPTTTEFKAHAPGLKLDWSASKVGRAFRSWRNAQKAYEGQTFPESARQVRQREAAARANRGHAGLLGIVAQWVEDNPDGATREDYIRWREHFNDHLPPDERRAPVWQQLKRAFPSSVSDIRAAAVETTIDPVALAQVRAEERLARDPNPLGIAGTSTAGRAAQGQPDGPGQCTPRRALRIAHAGRLRRQGPCLPRG